MCVKERVIVSKEHIQELNLSPASPLRILAHDAQRNENRNESIHACMIEKKYVCEYAYVHIHTPTSPFKILESETS